MKQLQPVIWGKGFVTPQHLQMQERFVGDMRQFELQAMNFRPWGFSDLAIDQQKLSEGVFAISRASGIFPEGLLFDIPNSDPAPGAKFFAEYFTEGQTSLDVYLAVPEFRQRGINVSLDRKNIGTRYVAAIEMFCDENTGTREKAVQVARKNFNILIEGESLDGYSKLKIANVERTGVGTFRSNPAFVPALLSIAASKYLMIMLRGLVEVLHAKSSELAGKRHEKNESLAEFTASDIANFWLLYAVNSHFPVFSHIYASKKGHPEELFAGMLDLAGTLTTFSRTVQPRDLAMYDHDDLGKCFTKLNEQLRSLLETVVPTNVVSLALNRVQTSIYATDLAEERFLTNTRMYLAVSADMAESDLIRKSSQLLKVCSANHIEHLIKQALPGMTLTHMSAPPSAIPMKLKYQYFALSQSGIAWEAVQRSRNLAVYIPGDFVNPQIELVILLPQAK
jgi:type VI secretion system protein ImpJ